MAHTIARRAGKNQLLRNYSGIKSVSRTVFAKGGKRLKRCAERATLGALSLKFSTVIIMQQFTRATYSLFYSLYY
ncbi:hypothetical protein GCM10009022_13190 [Vreelandella titanicae]